MSGKHTPLISQAVLPTLTLVACFMPFFSIGCVPSGPSGVNLNTNSAPDPCGEAGVICTYAGTGVAAFTGDGLRAIETTLYFPIDVAFDAQGRLLIDDWNNLRIRRVNDDGTIETIIGLDFEDVPIDGALAKETALHHASDIEHDEEGNLLIAGDHAPVVIEIRPDERVYTIAGGDDYGYDGDGGPALEATLGAPFGILPDGASGFYFSDVDFDVVRHVDSNDIITTVAGTGESGYSGDGGPATSALLNTPTRLRFHADGRLMICDTDNHAIRVIDSDGTISTLAGTGARGYSGDGGPATAAEFNGPYEIRVAPGGDLYVADSGNHVIRRIDAEGVVSTVVGTGAEGFSGDLADASQCQLKSPAGLLFDDEGNLWICDTGNHRVRRVAGFLNAFE